jgi:hypothetical protein
MVVVGLGLHLAMLAISLVDVAGDSVSTVLWLQAL